LATACATRSIPTCAFDATHVTGVLIATPLEAELVERIRAVDPRLDVVYRPELIGAARFPADHHPVFERSAAQAAEWARLLANAEVLYDVDGPNVRGGLVERAPRLRWVQATSSGVGPWMERLGLRDTNVAVTNAAGIHAVPLGEFVLMAMLYFAKRMPLVNTNRALRHWELFAGDVVRGHTVAVIGLGGVGREVARLAHAIGMRVIGMRRRAEPGDDVVEAIFGPQDVLRVLAQSDFVVLIAPATPETESMLGEREIRAMRPGAVLINIARGSLVDEQALERALRDGHLSGAALDVMRQEPLLPDSPFWTLPNVLLTPHSMSTAINENELLTDLFCENLARYLAGQPLKNLIDKSRGY
jgi:glyoxylate/hydroxypyruvate reductase